MSKKTKKADVNQVDLVTTTFYKAMDKAIKELYKTLDMALFNLDKSISRWKED